MNPAASDIENLNVMVQQQALDREHMAVLKQAIERLHDAGELQRLAAEASEKRFEEQAAVNLRMFKEHAELRGACTQHAVRMDTKFNDIIASIKGQDMVDLVEAVATDMIEIKIETAFKALSNDVEKMKGIIDLHETQKQNMASYLDNLMGERPAEGAVIMKSFELVDTKILNVTAEVARQYADTSEQIAFLKSSLMQAGAQPSPSAYLQQTGLTSTA